MAAFKSKAKLIDDIHDAEADKNLTEKDSYIFELIKDYVVENRSVNHQRQTELLSALRDDQNLIGSTVVKRLIAEAIISEYDLPQIGIDPVFIEALGHDLLTKAYPKPDGPLDKIGNLSTEVYFWGIPASGKTCAIGALLSMAFKTDLDRLQQFKEGACQGRQYMSRLTEMFPYDPREGVPANVMPLPSGTPVKYTYEMFFELTDKKRNVYPITFIDMAGELVRCMYKKNKGEQLSTEEEAALQTVTNVLKDNRTANQKLHFFVLEYGGEHRRYEGVSQTRYLLSAIDYLSNIDAGGGQRFNVFESKTDAIYLLVTQVDKAGQDDDCLASHVRSYMNGPQSYNSIANQLQNICQTYHINGGRLAVLLFSLGEVCFKDYCRFNPRFTRNALQTLLSHMYSYSELQKKPWFKKFYQWMTS